MLEQIAREHSDIRVFKVDVYANQKVTGKYSIQALPTMILFQGGKESKKLVGALPKKEILREIRGALRKK